MKNSRINSITSIIRPLYIISTLLMLALPFSLYAIDLGATNSTTFGQVIGYVTDLIYQTIPILILLAFILFFWGLSKFVIGASNEKELATGKEYMLWGILALFILISVRSILTIVATDLFDKNTTSGAPLLPTGGAKNTDTTTQFKPSSTLQNSQ